MIGTRVAVAPIEKGTVRADQAFFPQGPGDDGWLLFSAEALSVAVFVLGDLDAIFALDFTRRRTSFQPDTQARPLADPLCHLG